MTSPGPGATAAIRYFLILNNSSRAKEKRQQELGPTVNCERFQQIYPKSFTPEFPPSAMGIAQCKGGTQPPAPAFCPSGAHYPVGQTIQEILPPSVPASLFLEAQRKAQAAAEMGLSHGALGFGVYWVTQPLPVLGPPQTRHPPTHGGSGHQRRRTGRPDLCQVLGAAPAEPAPHLGRCVPRAGPVPPSPPLHELLGDGVGVEAAAAGAQGGVAQLQVRGPAVHVVLGEGGGPGQVVGVEDVGFLPGLAGQALLWEALVLHQVRVVGVLAALRRRQRVLRESGVSPGSRGPQVTPARCRTQRGSPKARGFKGNIWRMLPV